MYPVAPANAEPFPGGEAGRQARLTDDVVVLFDRHMIGADRELEQGRPAGPLHGCRKMAGDLQPIDHPVVLPATIGEKRNLNLGSYGLDVLAEVPM